MGLRARWVRSLPQANGRVGMYGFSYQAITQLLAAAHQPDGLVCIAPGMAACDLYQGWFYHHGALRLASSLVGVCRCSRPTCVATNCVRQRSP